MGLGLSLAASDLSQSELPFEFRAMESILMTITTDLNARFERLEPIIDAALKRLRTNAGSMQTQMQVASAKHDVDDLEVRVRSLREAMDEVLESDEDMALMYLTKHFRFPFLFDDPDWRIFHEEAELLLENYLQTVENLQNRVELLRRDIDSVEDSVRLCCACILYCRME